MEENGEKKHILASTDNVSKSQTFQFQKIEIEYQYQLKNYCMSY